MVTPDGFLPARELAIPHVWHLRQLCKEHYQFRYTLGEEFVKECLLASQHCLANSHATAKAYGLSSAPNTSVIYNPLSLPEHTLERTAPTSCNTLCLLSIGHRTEVKGHLDAIQATHALIESGHNIRLTIVGGGDGTYRESCEKEVQQRGLSSSVSFIRSVENPWELLGSSDLFLQCSQHEAFGRVTVEAMLARCPVLGRNSGGTPEIIENGQTGFLFNDTSELPDKILSVLKREDLEEITNRAFTVATTRFSPNKIAEEVLAIYNTLC